MTAIGATLLRRLADSSIVRRLLEVVFAARSRWHLARLDETNSTRAQLRALLGLLHAARATPFARDHDFARIRTADDFRRLVPLRLPTDLWRAYGQAGHAWPSSTLIATPHPALGDRHRPVAVSPQLLTSQRRALRTALALVLDARPKARLLAGPIVWLGDDTFLFTRDGKPASSAALLPARFPRWLRPALQAGLTWDCQDRQHVDSVLPTLARRMAQEAPTCLVGPAERIASLLDQVSVLRQGNPWPSLTAILYTKRDPTFPVTELRKHLDPSVQVLEMLALPQGPVAVEDPRHGGLRLLTDHGVYFELLTELQDASGPTHRLGLDEARVGVPYELVITSAAGVWACRTGLRICFDSLSPPLLRMLPAQPHVSATIRSDGPCAIHSPPPHRQSAGNPEAPPETFVHSPWSAPVDRG